MTAEERLAQLEMELVRERAKMARLEAERASERAENGLPAKAYGASLGALARDGRAACEG